MPKKKMISEISAVIALKDFALEVIRGNPEAAKFVEALLETYDEADHPDVLDFIGLYVAATEEERRLYFDENKCDPFFLKLIIASLWVRVLLGLEREDNTSDVNKK